MEHEQPTAEGNRLISSWLRCQSHVAQCREALGRAQIDAATTEQALIAWMIPDVIRATPGEKIAIWAGDSLIQVEVGGVESGGDALIKDRSSTRATVRYRGKHFNELTR